MKEHATTSLESMNAVDCKLDPTSSPVSPPGSPRSPARRRLGLAMVGAGGLTIGFRLGFAQTPPVATVPAPAATVPAVPVMIRNNPALDSWVRVAPDGVVTVFTGRVEFGQGCLTVMRQIAAEELDLAPARIELVSVDTARSPNEGVTSGSFAVKQGGAALGLACADARATLVRAAGEAWGVPATQLTVDDGVIRGPGNQQMSYGDAASRVSLVLQVDPSARRKPPGQQRIIGTSYPRVDIPAKVFGQQIFIHDMRPSGMLFGSVARPPTYASRLVSLDVAAIERLPGVVSVVRDGSFVGVVARREEQARAAVARIGELARWEGGAPLFGSKTVFDYMLTTPAEVKLIHQIGTAPGPSSAPAAPASHRNEYRRAFQAHASIGASCALAQWNSNGKLSVWSHTQGPFPLRSHLAKALRVAAGDIRVVHLQGSGCYGHNGADDVALDAALLARAMPGVPVRVHWAHEEEMAWEPWGSAMIVKLAADVGADGRLTSWQHDVWSFPHSSRPGPSGGMDGCNLRSAWYLAEPLKASRAVDGALPNGAAGRNAVPIYAAAHQRVTTHFLPDMPIRTSALRTLGGYFNAVSAEMFIDEIAARNGRDPVSFRLANVDDPRLVEVLKKAVAMSGWSPAPVVLRKPAAGEMRGTGVGLSRYKNQDCYVAVVAQVVVDSRSGAVKVEQLWSAVDTGRAINPDGVINQIEGGMVQATSWTLIEAGQFDDGIMQSVDYAGYPIIRFMETPVMQTTLIDRPELPSLGAGEGSQAPAGAAIANAVYAAIGRRVTQVPITAQQVLAALSVP